MSQRVIAIGDIHGCAVAFGKLLELIRPEADDTIIVLGDCVDRGPESRQVIEQLLQVRDACQLVPILGNHEEMMLNFLDDRPQPDNWLFCGGDATLKSYRGSDGAVVIPPEHVEYIRTWGDCHMTDTHFFVHAAYHSEHAFAEQRWPVWRWHTLRKDVPAPHVSGKTAIVGHTSQKSGEILDLGHLICIDTYCWGGGWLTGLDATTGQVWQIGRDGRIRQKV